ncbi:MAG: lysylphosphatidylglycerol synthase transmembrane domain-containing protein [Chloroflexota bacterium]
MKRNWILWLLLVAFAWLLVTRREEAEILLQTLQRGRWAWVMIATLMQMMYYLFFAASYWSAFNAVEVKSKLRDLVPITFAALFVNVVAPTGGTGGAALFLDDARRRGQSSSRAAAGTLFQLVAHFGSFSLVLLVGLTYLFLQGNLRIHEVLAAVILLGMVSVLSTILLLGLWRPDWLQRLMYWIQRTANRGCGRFQRVPFFEDDWAIRHSREFADAASAIGKSPARLIRTLGIALAAHVFNLLCLYVLFRAFGENITFGPLVAGYAVGLLFWIVSPTPQGIGIVEGMMVLVFTSLHIRGEIAATVVLAFRGLAFWLPLGVGFLMLHRIEAFKAREKKLERKKSLTGFPNV